VQPFFFGDSIAVGYGGKSPGQRRVGAGPAEVYSFLQQQTKNNTNPFKGALVNLSTGVSNNPSDFASIENQLKLLSASGANVNVLGAAQGRYNSQNQKLQKLSQRYGFNFLGGFEPGADLVHPKTYSSYNGAGLGLFSSPGSSPATSASALPQQSQGAPVGPPQNYDQANQRTQDLLEAFMYGTQYNTEKTKKPQSFLDTMKEQVTASLLNQALNPGAGLNTPTGLPEEYTRAIWG
jgi:hypothetical protein